MENEKKEYFGWCRLQTKIKWFMVKITFSVDHLERLLDLAKSDRKNTVSVNLKEMRQAKDNGVTHYLELDTWKPANQDTKQAETAGNEQAGEDQLPF